MNRIDTALPGVCILEPKVFGDHRGYFMETYSKAVFEDLGIHGDFVQDNLSYTQKKGTLRGIHYQMNPMAQSKIVRASRGTVMDLAVDLRKGSPTYLQWILVELSEQNKRMFYIPRGFGHGFITMTDDVEFSYKVDNLYASSCDRSIRFDDPTIGVDWGVSAPILSAKDLAAPLLKDSDCNFTYSKLEENI